MTLFVFGEICIGIIFFCLLIFRLSLYFKKYKKSSDKPFLDFLSCLLSLIISFLTVTSFRYLVYKQNVCPFILLSAAIIYVAIIASIKCVTTYLICKNESFTSQNNSDLDKLYEAKKDFWFFHLDCVLYSPDYCCTYIYKNFLFKTEKERERRAKIVKSFNVENILLSFFFGIILIFLFNFAKNSTLFETFLFFMGVRFISRSMEIIISFLKDILDKEKTSSLRKPERIRLTFYSLFEVVFSSICIFYCQSGGDFLSALLNSLSSINGAWAFGDGISGFGLIKVFESLTCFSLLGLVISTYLSEECDVYKSTSSNLPQLFVIRDGYTQMTIPFNEDPRTHEYYLKIHSDTASSEYIIYFPEKGKKANECYWSTSLPSEGRNFCLEKGEYCIFFDPKSKRIDIRNINEKKE